MAQEEKEPLFPDEPDDRTPMNNKENTPRTVDGENIDYDTAARTIFYGFVICLEAIGVLCIALIVGWSIKFVGGYAWSGAAQFNYHPTFMVVGFIFLYGNSAIIYRVLRYQEKFQVKLIHAGLHAAAFVFIVIGLCAVFDFHNNNNIPNVYSLHSWIGIGTTVLFACQLLFGFLMFLFPKGEAPLRKSYLKIHVYFGGVIFALAVGACITGLTEKMLFAFKKEYSQFVPVGNIANVFGVLLILFAMMVGYVIYNPAYKRQEIQ